jgi:hypothetical protein
MFAAPAATGHTPVVIELSGIEVIYKDRASSTPKILRGIPSFKTGKTAFGWLDRATNKIMARPLTLPQHAKWMKLAILSIESQLRSALGITDAKIRTAASARSWIASLLPLDDSWRWCPEITVTSRLCRDGEEEGATITITRL